MNHNCSSTYIIKSTYYYKYLYTLAVNMTNTTDLDWQQFINAQNNLFNPNFQLTEPSKTTSSSTSSTSSSECNKSNDEPKPILSKTPEQIALGIHPLYISTRTKIFYLNAPALDVAEVFWKLPVMDYNTAASGIVKKQITVKLRSKKEVSDYMVVRDQGVVNTYHQERVTKEVTNDNVNARRNQFKIERIMSVGVSKKDIMNCHAKEKRAFINCFALTYRIYSKKTGRYCELHMKIFGTCKLTIPGIIDSDDVVDDLQEHLVKLLAPHITMPEGSPPLAFLPEDQLPMKRCIVNNKRGGKLPTITIVANNAKQTASSANKKIVYTPTLPDILINSNFNCGFHILQSRFGEILASKYGLTTLHNDMNYPGIKCYYYINNRLPLDKHIQTGQIDPNDYTLQKSNPIEFIEKYTKVTFISFRTGRVLILGAFSKKVLLFTYDFVKEVLVEEYPNIRDVYGADVIITKPKMSKPRRRTVAFTPEYLEYLTNL